MSVMVRLKLYDFRTSPNCQRVKVVLEEKKLPYETIPIDLRKKEQKMPKFLELNPYGKVPVIVDGETVLYESCIINEYLEEKYPEPPLMPKDPAQRANIRILIDYSLNYLNPPYQTIRAQMTKDEKERDREVLASAKGEVKNLLKRLEQAMGSQSYLAGDFSLLDAAVIPRFLRLEGWGLFPDSSLPGLTNWLKRIKDRPSIQIIM